MLIKKETIEAEGGLLAFRVSLLTDWAGGIESSVPRYQPPVQEPKNPSTDLLLAFPSNVIVSVTRHWLWHAYDIANHTWSREAQQVFDINLHEHVTQATSPALGITTIISFTERLLHETYESLTLSDEYHTDAARQAIRIYAVMAPIVQEACVCLCTLAAPWQSSSTGIDAAMLQLEEYLQHLLAKAELTGFRIESTSYSYLTDYSPMLRKFPTLVATSLLQPHLFRSRKWTTCHERNIVQWHTVLQHEYPITLRQHVPLMTSEPFPNLDIFPPTLGNSDTKMDEDPVSVGGLEAVTILISWVARSLMAVTSQHTLSAYNSVHNPGPAYTSDYALSSYGQMRSRLCDIFDGLLMSDLAHYNQNTIPTLTRVAGYLDATLQRIVDIGGNNGLYDFRKGSEVSPTHISAAAWMPHSIFRHSYVTPGTGEAEGNTQVGEDWTAIDSVAVAPVDSFSA